MPCLPRGIWSGFGETERRDLLAAFKDAGIDLTGLQEREKGHFADLSTEGQEKVLELLWVLRQVLIYRVEVTYAEQKNISTSSWHCVRMTMQEDLIR